MKFKDPNIKLLTEKGKCKADIRKRLLAKVDTKPELFAKAEKVKDGVYQIPYNAENGETVYIRFTVQVSEKNAHDLAEPKKKG